MPTVFGRWLLKKQSLVANAFTLSGRIQRQDMSYLFGSEVIWKREMREKLLERSWLSCNEKEWSHQNVENSTVEFHFSTHGIFSKVPMEFFSTWNGFPFVEREREHWCQLIWKRRYKSGWYYVLNVNSLLLKKRLGDHWIATKKKRNQKNKKLHMIACRGKGLKMCHWGSRYVETWKKCDCLKTLWVLVVGLCLVPLKSVVPK